ncbi:MAG: 3'-5' exonuclease [Bacteroidota bacterium]
MFVDTITNQEINELELNRYEGEIVMVDKAEDLSKIFREIRKENVVGFDTETKPAFKKGQVHDVSLVQIATEEKAYIIRINHTGITNEIYDFLSSKDIVKVGVALRDDLKDLQRLRPFTPEGFEELNQLVKPIGIESNGLRKLTAIILGFRISKSAQTSNWESETLTEKQLNYAATDAWVCIKMYNSLVYKGYL